MFFNHSKNKYFSTLKAILGLIALVLILPNFVFKGLIAFFGWIIIVFVIGANDNQGPYLHVDEQKPTD